MGNDCDLLLSLDAVKQLETVNKPLHEMLVIFVNGTSDQYTTWAKSKANMTFLTDNGFDHENNLSKMRTLTICSIGTEKDAVSYAEIQSKLSLANADEVESCVIEAVVSLKLDAK